MQESGVVEKSVGGGCPIDYGPLSTLVYPTLVRPCPPFALRCCKDTKTDDIGAAGEERMLHAKVCLRTGHLTLTLHRTGSLCGLRMSCPLWIGNTVDLCSVIGLSDRKREDWGEGKQRNRSNCGF